MPGSRHRPERDSCEPGTTGGAQLSSQRLALVHEWIDARAGSEQVFEALAGVYPNADLFALTADPTVRLNVGDRRIHTTWLDHHKFLRHQRALTLPLMPVAWRSFRCHRYDAVISSHHAFAHTNTLARTGIHLAYVHSPARYVWTPEIDARGAGGALMLPREVLKWVDRRAARRVTGYAANSNAVAARIERFWHRESVVIPPPVRTTYFSTSCDSLNAPRRDYLLGAGRWVAYKNLHLVVDVASRLGMSVKIAGAGPERQRIIAAAHDASVPAEVIESPDDEALRELYRNAAALVYPAVEDFGMIPVEAQAAGTPVVAPRAGGAIDTVIEGQSGWLTDTLSIDALADATQNAIGLPPEGCQESAERFSESKFQQRIEGWAAGYGVAPGTAGAIG